MLTVCYCWKCQHRSNVFIDPSDFLPLRFFPFFLVCWFFFRVARFFLFVFSPKIFRLTCFVVKNLVPGEGWSCRHQPVELKLEPHNFEMMFFCLSVCLWIFLFCFLSFLFFIAFQCVAVLYKGNSWCSTGGGDGRLGYI